MKTSEITSFCIDNRLYVKGVFSCLPKWAKAGFRVKMKDFEMKKTCSTLFVYYIKQIDSVAVGLFSNRSQL